MIIERACVRQVKLPLLTPYKVSLMTMKEFDPFIVELFDDRGNVGFGEALIAPGYTSETIEGSWAHCDHLLQEIVGLAVDDAAAVVTPQIPAGVGAASAVLAAIDMLAGHPILAAAESFSVPLLAPLHASQEPALESEIEARLADGFRTLKVKVGFAWKEDLERVRFIQSCLRGRASLRLDANQGFSVADGRAFATALDPQGIELFEQPCHMDDWDGNAEVAAVSTVPIMLDESIYDVADIDRASAIEGVGFVKLKLKKIGSLEMLENALRRIRSHGLVPVLGDGVSAEIGCWMEACVARSTIDNAGEMNGFLKTRESLFETPLVFESGAIRIPSGFSPRLDQQVVARSTIRSMEHAVGSRRSTVQIGQPQ